jgi:hypothetical protein
MRCCEKGNRYQSIGNNRQIMYNVTRRETMKYNFWCPGEDCLAVGTPAYSSMG